MGEQIKVISYDITDSTNERAKQYAKGGMWSGETVAFIANGQTMGRGRYARRFYSESGAGVYLSLLFKPNSSISDTTAIVAHTANSMIKAIEEQADVRLGIKWVNDLILGGRKLGGILIEGALSADGRGYDHLIAGIGVNLYGTSLPDEISDIATTVEAHTGVKVDKDRLVERFIYHFTDDLENAGSADTLELYRSRLMTVGAEVTVHTLTEQYDARVTALLPDYSLLVTLPDGTQKRIFTGEVSIKAKK